MIKIGLFGEAPTDTDSIKNLLSPWLKGRAQFVTLLNNRRGGHLDNQKTIDELQIEVDDRKPDIVVVVRDSDCIRSQEHQLKGRHEWFQRITESLMLPKILLLNIFELEALILADISSFNKQYNVDIKAQGEVSMKADPKGFLKDKTSRQRKKFQESACPEIFTKLDIDVVRKNCGYFREFLVVLDVELNALKMASSGVTGH